jgi:hypothetical protein
MYAKKFLFKPFLIQECRPLCLIRVMNLSLTVTILLRKIICRFALSVGSFPARPSGIIRSKRTVLESRRYRVEVTKMDDCLVL